MVRKSFRPGTALDDSSNSGESDGDGSQIVQPGEGWESGEELVTPRFSGAASDSEATSTARVRRTRQTGE